MSEPRRILVTGSRDWTEREVVRRLLSTLPEHSVVVSGGARGLDHIAHSEAFRMGFDTDQYKATWARHGQAAGSLRNQAMVDAGADECWAFPLPGSVGTYDCMRRARMAGIRVRMFRPDGSEVSDG